MQIVRLHSVALLEADAIDLRYKHCLIIVAAKSGRFIILNQRALAAALAAGAALRRLGCLHYEGLVAPTHAVGGVDRRGCLQRSGVSCVLGMVLIDQIHSGHAAQKPDQLFIIPFRYSEIQLVAVSLTAHKQKALLVYAEDIRTEHGYIQITPLTLYLPSLT